MKSPSRNFHTADLLSALNAQPHDLRAWLQLEPLSSREKVRRCATAYSALDVLFLALIKQLHVAGFSPKALQTFSASLYKALQHQPGKDEPDELLLYFSAAGFWKVGRHSEGADGLELRVPLQEIRLNLLRYTGAHLISPQLEMVMLAAIPNRSSRGINSGGGNRRRVS